MATANHDQTSDLPENLRDHQPSEAWATVRTILKPLASLKLTVALFLMAIFIVLAGTFAQVHHDIWKVVHDYFRVDFSRVFTATFPWFRLSEVCVWINPEMFFPESFFPSKPVFPTGLGWMSAFWPHGTPDFPNWFGFWFPKGWVIGTAMMFNLLAAHLVRFKIQARGTRLVLGTGIIAVGAVLTAAVILSGSNPDGLQAKPLITYDTLWWLFQTCLFGLCGVSLYAAFSAGSDRPGERALFGVLTGLLALAAVAAFRADTSSDSTMRILYQVIKATFSSSVLLAGCIAVFKRRGGIVLLHAGVGLMMCYDVLVGLEHVESQMHIVEGETAYFSRDLRESELAIIDHSLPDRDQVTVVDANQLTKPGTVIHDSRIPFDIEVVDYYQNSTLLGPQQKLPDGVPKENPATAGIGRRILAAPVAGSTGTDTESRFDVPSAYLHFSHEGDDLGTYLASGHFDLSQGTQSVEVDGQSYDIALRFRRLYNNYTITLKDVQKNDYKGTNTPRDYSSFIVLDDPDRGTKFEYRIWMNNPMRYGGKTFYQSSYAPLEGGREMTTLQVVDNQGWMTPYVACMMVVVGMLFHFGQTLIRYLHRRARQLQGEGLITDEGDETTADQMHHRQSRLDQIGWIVTAVVVGGVAASLVSWAMPRSAPQGEFHLGEFGALPMWYKGRSMPIDSFARNALMQLSDRQSFKDADGDSQAALVWLLDVMANEDKAREHRVIRIENADVREAIGVKDREGFAYSVAELNAMIDKIIEQAQAASQVPPKERNLFQRKTVELANRLIFYSFLERTLGTAPQLPAPEEPIDPSNVRALAGRAQNYFQFIRAARSAVSEFSEQYGLGPLPLVVPTHLGTEDDKRPDIDELNSQWESVTLAHVYDQFYQEFPAPTPPAIADFLGILDAYSNGDVQAFNTRLDEYESLLKQAAPADVPLTRVSFESWYNRVSAFNLISWLYVGAFVLAVLGWLAWPQVFQRSAFWLTVLLFLVHTAALLGRIYISGRPPVTNLYSSAVFIGWAIVLGGLIIEALTRLGVGTVVGTVAGFLTLRIAHGLAADGDTFVVLEAVLDTQFWLATHVVCITLGYATTYMAGLFGLLYVIRGVGTPYLDGNIRRELSRMIYGTICFATFFSFWGTVLGGLWADDSWGRFWGWDPKENGALIIVLWNALVLHARWGGLVRERGLAVLAVLGNIVVSWSWFGVNELGVGLHSYGFTEGRLMMLALFVMSQFVIACVGCLPKRLWWSNQHPEGTIESVG